MTRGVTYMKAHCTTPCSRPRRLQSVAPPARLVGDTEGGTAMSSSAVRIGVIGANAERGWAAMTHLPAIDALDECELVAVATTRPESAEATALRYGARRSYTDPHALVADPEIDVVTVAVRD